jgi:hypothetical protein
MTVSLSTQQAPPPPAKAATATDSSAVRKRRRRVTAGGAADDCFTCSKRNVKCDRRRPYCSQCLEVGNECSGYKTQLTWGVGVASRGKFRGLTLPIAKAPPVNAPKKSPTRVRADSNNTNKSSSWSDRGDVSPKTRRNHLEVPQEVISSHSLPTTPFHPGFNLAQISQAEGAPSLSQPTWTTIPFSTSLPADGFTFQKLPMTSAADHLSGSIDSLSDMDYMSPMSHAFSREEVPFVNSPTILYDSYTGNSSPVPQSPVSALMIEQRAAPTSCPSLVYAPSDHSSSLPSHGDAFEAQLSSKLLQDCDSLGMPASTYLERFHTDEPGAGTPDLDSYSTSAHSAGHFWGPHADEDAISHGGHSPNPAAWPSMFEAQPMALNPDLVARMPFFLDYYEKTMCPSMVFIDGPNNPFRDHILQLTNGSSSLQHAICALAACNMRMKRKLSLGQHGPDSPEESPLDDHTLSEEYQHRNLAVHLLNEQLNDPAKSRHDSVLATILILCHYRMAESGIAKFHTQFAGVKKILAMRRQSSFPPSRDSAWMEALFTYFDAISASINDRETQLNTSFYGVMPDAQLLPAGAENLVGCDRELFKTIIKLGRLNLLSQHRPVQNLMASSSMARGIPSRSQSPLSSPLGHATFKPGHQHHLSADLGSFGAQPFNAALEEEDLANLAVGSPAYDDHRSTFWREWKEARIALQGWEFDPARLLASLPASHPPTPTQIRDLGHLSEAFRYAALLYTERLASPNVPSAHNNFRNLVSQVVYYATSLEAGSSAEKFLLWPLFVAGSECVNELQQNIVRSKCREIMTRSGYMNNLAALDVLERVWAGDFRDESTAVKMGMVRQGPFSWTRCIAGVGGDVEWIMF